MESWFNSPFLSIMNLLNWQLLPDDQARVVPGALVSKVFNILDVLEGVGLGVPCHNVGSTLPKNGILKMWRC